MSTWLITGANRGIGRGLVTLLLARPNTTVIAALRDTADVTAKEIAELPLAAGSRLIVVKIDAESETDALEAVGLLQSKYNITKLDVVLANSGLLDQWGPVSKVTSDELRRHFEINTIAPIKLFQATKALLDGAENPRFCITSTNIASLGLMRSIPMPTIAYGLTKAAANYALAKIHYEDSKITTIALHPGWVQTRMGQHAADLAGVADIPVTVSESATGLLKQVRSEHFLPSSAE
jgi:norsolorinic acid ketoreductase